MSRNVFNVNIPANWRISKAELVDILKPMVGEALAVKFSNMRCEPEDIDPEICNCPADSDETALQTDFILPDWATDIMKDKLP